MKFETTKLILFQSGSLIEDDIIVLLFPARLLVNITFVKNILLSKSLLTINLMSNTQLGVKLINFNDFLNYTTDELFYVGIFSNKDIYLSFNISTTSKYANRVFHYNWYVSEREVDQSDEINLVLSKKSTLIVKSSEESILINDELDCIEIDYSKICIKISFFLIVVILLFALILI